MPPVQSRRDFVRGVRQAGGLLLGARMPHRETPPGGALTVGLVRAKESPMPSSPSGHPLASDSGELSHAR